MLENEMKSLIVVYSYHQKNTEKVAKVIANTIGAEVKCPEEIKQEELKKYDMIGFGAGIDSGKHYEELLSFADDLQSVNGKLSFVFSTSAVQGKQKVYEDHSCLRDQLILKGYKIVDEFSCKGFNTNSFLKVIGGMNKGRPNESDLKNAEAFAYNLLKKIRRSD